MLRSISRILSALLVGTLGCVARPEAQVGRGSHAIINGEASGPEDDSAVALPLFNSAGQFTGACSGVLIAANLVLTARHCVSRTAAGGIACDEEGNPIVGGGVLGDFDAEQIRVLVGPEVAFDFPATGKQILHSGATTLCNADIALVVLDQAIPDAKFAKIRLDSKPVEGDKILAVGWGQSNNSSGIGRRRRGNIPVEHVGPFSRASQGIALGPAELGVGESICQGDSGGPAYDMKTGAVIGVVSRGGNGAMPTEQDPTLSCVDAGGFVTHNIYTRTDGFKALIMEAFAAAGTEPWLENGPDPRKAKFGEACAVAGDCRSALCLGNLCTDACSPEVATCPEGFTCQAEGAGHACKVPPPVPPSGCATTPATPHPGAGGVGLFLLLAILAARGRSRPSQGSRQR